MLPMFRRLFRSSPIDKDNAKKIVPVTPDAHLDKRAFHESIFKGGQLPPGVPPPKEEKLRIVGYGHVSEKILTNVFVPILAAPGVGVRSFLNKARYGHMDCAILDVDFAVGPPQFLCDGNVYALGLAKLPLPHLPKSGFAVDSRRMAVILAFAVDDLTSVEEAKELYRRLAQSFKLKSPGKHPLPFPAMLLGMRADDHPTILDAEDAGGQWLAEQSPTTGTPEGQGSTPGAINQKLAIERSIQASAKQFAEQNGLLYGECSAKTGHGIFEAMCKLVEEIEADAKTDLDPEDTLQNMRDVWIPTVAKITQPRQTTDLAVAKQKKTP